MKKILLKLTSTIGFIFSFIPNIVCEYLFIGAIWLFAAGRGPNAGLKLLLELNNKLYILTTKLAIKYGNGTHPKHRLTQYHQYFISRINKEDNVLDIGCGSGILAYDIASNSNAKITAVDIIEANINAAKQNKAHENITYLHDDATTMAINKPFTVVVLSNVLEHIENRVEFLEKIKTNIGNAKILLRVPMYERDWRVPLMDELGVDYRLDPTHFTEYKQGELEQDCQQAHYEISDKIVQWGEIYCVLTPK